MTMTNSSPLHLILRRLAKDYRQRPTIGTGGSRCPGVRDRQRGAIAQQIVDECDHYVPALKDTSNRRPHCVAIQTNRVE
jgi:hypothetical protein